MLPRKYKDVKKDIDEQKSSYDQNTQALAIIAEMLLDIREELTYPTEEDWDVKK